MAVVNGPNDRNSKRVQRSMLCAVVPKRRSRRARAGQAIVETALLFPILCLLVLGSTDLGRVFYYSIEMTNAAREGARFGSSYDPAGGNAAATHAAVIAAARNEAADLTLVEPSPAFSPVNCQSGPPYADAYYPTDANTGYIFACFADNDSLSGGTAGQTIRVTILYNFSPATPLIDGLSGNVHLQATTTMLIQGQQ
jgi:Flp pilus assembly protein TadG